MELRVRIWDNDLRDYCDPFHLNLRGGLKLTRSIVLAAIYKFNLPMYAYSTANFIPRSELGRNILSQKLEERIKAMIAFRLLTASITHSSTRIACRNALFSS